MISEMLTENQQSTLPGTTIGAVVFKHHWLEMQILDARVCNAWWGQEGMQICWGKQLPPPPTFLRLQ